MTEKGLSSHLLTLGYSRRLGKKDFHFQGGSVSQKGETLKEMKPYHNLPSVPVWDMSVRRWDRAEIVFASVSDMYRLSLLRRPISLFVCARMFYVCFFFFFFGMGTRVCPCPLGVQSMITTYILLLSSVLYCLETGPHTDLEACRFGWAGWLSCSGDLSVCHCPPILGL